MSLTTENILLIGSVLLLLSVLAGKTSSRFGIPVLLFFLTIGMLAGSEGIGGINFDNHEIAQFIGVVALNFILFSGGFETSLKSVKPVLWHGITMSTLGVLITTIAVGFFVHLLTDFTIYEGLLLGAIVSSTDSAAVFSILRSKNLALKNNLRPLLELESGSNDPMAYVLTIAFLGLVTNHDATIISTVPLFLKQIILGAVFGLAFGAAGKYIINRIKLDIEGLYIVLVVTLMLMSFSVTDYSGGNGFLAVYLSAVYLGNNELIHKRTILKTFDGFAWLMQIVLFLTLGLLVFPSHIIPVIGIGLVISAFLIFVARPLSVFISLIPFKLKFRSRWFISFVGLRGAVPIVFATYPLIAGIDKADMIFNIVFFISITSVLLQGTTLSVVAKWLGLSLPEKMKQLSEIDNERLDTIKSLLHQIVIPENSKAAGKEIVEIGFPGNTNISIIQRGEDYITPGGSTVLEAGDILFLLSENTKALEEVYDCLGIKNEDLKKKVL